MFFFFFFSLEWICLVSSLLDICRMGGDIYKTLNKKMEQSVFCLKAYANHATLRKCEINY